MTNHEDISNSWKKDSTDSTSTFEKEDNLIAQSFPKELNWSQSNRDESLQKVYNFVNAECKNAISWYYKSKKWKKIWGYGLRFFAILAVAIAGVIPILDEIFEEFDTLWLSPTWATLSLALAALFVALDQLGGYTTGWVRYVRTAQKLTILQGNFRLDWEETCLSIYDKSDKSSEDNSNERIIDSETAKKCLKLCKNFLQSVNSEVQAETDAWAQEFQQALLDIDQQSDANKRRAGNTP